MALPYVKIKFANGAIGGTEAMEDGVTLMLVDGLTADIVCQNIEDYRNKLGDSDTELAEVVAFYNEVGGNSKLILSTCELTDAALKAKISEYNGDIRIVVVKDVASVQNAKALQAVADWSTNTLFAPLMFLISCTDDLDDIVWTNQQLSRVAVVDTLEDSAETPLLYYVAGRIARIPVQRSLARVKDGALYPTEVYTQDGDLVDNLYAETRHSKGVITARIFVGKTGFYIADDQMAISVTDDYAYIPRRRTIDKAFRIAYNTLVNYVGDEIPIQDGKIPASTCMDIQNAVEQAIYYGMTVEGNLGTANEQDKGVICFVDPNQDIVVTNKLELSLKVKPYGYSKYIEVLLGFTTEG